MWSQTHTKHNAYSLLTVQTCHNVPISVDHRPSITAKIVYSLNVWYLPHVSDSCVQICMQTQSSVNVRHLNYGRLSEFNLCNVLANWIWGVEHDFWNLSIFNWCSVVVASRIGELKYHFSTCHWLVGYLSEAFCTIEGVWTLETDQQLYILCNGIICGSCVQQVATVITAKSWAWDMHTCILKKHNLQRCRCEVHNYFKYDSKPVFARADLLKSVFQNSHTNPKNT